MLHQNMARAWDLKTMTEIKTFLYQNEIQMLKDFMDTESNTKIDNLHLQWGPELQSLLTSLGHIITAPDFDLETLKQQYKKEDPS